MIRGIEWPDSVRMRTRHAETAYKSRRSPMDPPKLLHPNPRETREDGTAIVRAAEYKSMNQGDSSIEILGVLQ